MFMGGVYSGRRSDLPAFRRFRPITSLFTVLRTLLHSTKTQLFSFQLFPHSLPKTTGVGYPFHLGRHRKDRPNARGATLLSFFRSVRSVHGMLPLFPLLAQPPHPLPQTHLQRGNRFEPLLSAAP